MNELGTQLVLPWRVRFTPAVGAEVPSPKETGPGAWWRLPHGEVEAPCELPPVSRLLPTGPMEGPLRAVINPWQRPASKGDFRRRFVRGDAGCFFRGELLVKAESQVDVKECVVSAMGLASARQQPLWRDFPWELWAIMRLDGLGQSSLSSQLLFFFFQIHLGPWKGSRIIKYNQSIASIKARKKEAQPQGTGKGG